MRFSASVFLSERQGRFCGSIRKKQLWIAATANKLKARIRTGKTVPSFLISDPSHTGGPMNRRSL